MLSDKTRKEADKRTSQIKAIFEAGISIKQDPANSEYYLVINKETDEIYGEYKREINAIKKAHKILQDKGFEFVNNKWFMPGSFDKGCILLERWELNEAIEAFTQAIKNNENTPKNYLKRAQAFCLQIKYDEAIKDYNSALEYLPNNSDIYHQRGNAYRELKQYEKALDDYNKALVGTLDAELYLDRGQCYYLMDDNENCFKNYDTAVKMKPNYAKAYYKRGTAYREIKEYEKALEDFNEAIKLKPDYAYAYASRCEVNMRLNNDLDALADHTLACKYDADIKQYLKMLLNEFRYGF